MDPTQAKRMRYTAVVLTFLKFMESVPFPFPDMELESFPFLFLFGVFGKLSFPFPLPFQNLRLLSIKVV